ncbi:hypothetical protein [Chondromyces crocatus]|uniref:Uncharacterized protein n=1 Tax=Chondromyces crocatus TaxID=52 RepID=A0A0K1EA14_CHOCO|nr:hypothetical protein [Chondromyces crocatus]AKT37684.1 uncharacterized protein CMC5_018260 [Chondromyces crocatus]
MRCGTSGSSAPFTTVVRSDEGSARKHLAWLVGLAVAVTCAPGCNPRGREAAARAASDLDCPSEKIALQSMGDALYVASGCDKRVSYVCQPESSRAATWTQDGAESARVICLRQGAVQVLASATPALVPTPPAPTPDALPATPPDALPATPPDALPATPPEGASDAPPAASPTGASSGVPEGPVAPSEEAPGAPSAGPDRVPAPSGGEGPRP